MGKTEKGHQEWAKFKDKERILSQGLQLKV